jgi:hypothetical protein
MLCFIVDAGHCFGRKFERRYFKKMAETISEEVLVKVKIPTRDKGIPIKTTSLGPLLGDVRTCHRTKTSRRTGRFLFGSIIGGPYKEFEGQKPQNRRCLIRWAGRRHRTSLLPIELLM